MRVESVLQIPETASRAALRISGDYLLDWIAAVRAPFPGGIDSALIFTAILHGNIRDFAADAELNGLAEGQGQPRVPISARSIGRSLQLPFETTRRRAEALMAAGWIERRGEGLAVPPGVLSGPRLAGAADQVGVRLRATLTALAALGPSPQPFRLAPDRAPLALAVSGEYVLRWIERHVGAVGRMNHGVLIFWAVMQANIRHLIDDPALQAEYGDRTPPDDLRRPASIRQVAEALDLPYETVRLRVQKMFDLGLLTRVEGGVIATRQLMEQPESVASFRADLASLRRLLAQLTECGVLMPGEADFADR